MSWLLGSAILSIAGDRLDQFVSDVKCALKASLTTSSSQICHLHIGQAGVQLGNSAWELYAPSTRHRIRIAPTDRSPGTCWSTA